MQKHAGIELHLIGPLQSNKAKEAVALFTPFIRSTGRACARRWRRKSTNKSVNRFCSSRSILAPKRRRPACCRKTSTVSRPLPRQIRAHICGLMCIPPLDEAPGPHFALTAKIARRNGLEALVDGHERRFRDRDPARRHPCAGRQRDFRETARDIDPDCGSRHRQRLLDHDTGARAKARAAAGAAQALSARRSPQSAQNPAAPHG